MPAPSRLQIARDDIIKTFDNETVRRVYWPDDIARILEDHRAFWRVAKKTTNGGFIDFLLRSTYMRQVDMVPLHHNKASQTTRFVWREANPFEIAVTLRRGGYLCHGTAVYLHGLNDQIPHRLYVNKEQGEKFLKKNVLTQGGIDRAFSGKQRESRYIFEFDSSEVALLSGKHTRNEGVSELTYDERPIQITKIERTLIDIAVRPAYAGGPVQVLRAYQGAIGRVSISEMIAILRKLDYTYPYHQAIGYYMECAGFPLKQYDRLRQLGLNYDFYVTYGLTEKKYVSSWRLFVPSGLN